MIFTSQIPELAVRFADRIIVLGDSTVAADISTAGIPPDDLVRKLQPALGIHPDAP